MAIGHSTSCLVVASDDHSHLPIAGAKVRAFPHQPQQAIIPHVAKPQSTNRTHRVRSTARRQAVADPRSRPCLPCTVHEVDRYEQSCAMLLVSAPPGGGRHPALGFYPIFALSALTSTKSFWLRANVCAWTGQGRGRATEFFEVATSPASFFYKSGGNFKEFGLPPSHCTTAHR